ncbi:MAG: efflux RND transporter periplasmic adaptor subunit [Alphaproteobacteria bacterium]|nr:efflux RND transporter periplasmic adaptor subunit [Alphaproteobacteria bacterium]
MQKNKRWIYLGLICAVLVLGTYFMIQYFIGRRPFMYAGTLETTKVVLSSRVASDISEFFVIEGDTVSRDQLLLEMSCDVYKIMARQIDNDFARAAALKERGHMSAAEYDVLSRNKQDNDLKLDWCRVKSPMDGTVITKFREAGEVVAPGAPLISIANPYDIWAYFYVPYSVLYKLKVGQSVVGILPEANNMRFPGRIIKISEVAEFTPKNVQTRDERTRLVYGVKVRFENRDLILKSGMTIESNLTDEQ